MAIQNRRGNIVDFDPFKMLPGEFAYSLDTEELYYCVAPGNVKRCATKEDVLEILETNQQAYDGLQQLLAELESETVLTGILNNISTLLSDVAINKSNIATNTQDIINLDTKTMSHLAERALQTELEVEKARINNLATLAAGSTTGDAELIDARVGADGVTYPNAGGAVRGQFSKVSAQLADIESEVSSNLANPTNKLEGYSINASNGEPVANANYHLSDYIPITPSTVYTIAKTPRKAFYNINKEFISTDTSTGTFTSPSNAVFIRFVALPARWLSSVQLVLGGTLLAYEPWYKKIAYDKIKDVNITTEDMSGIVKTGTNILNKHSVTMEKVLDTTGAITDNIGYAISDFIKVKPGVEYIFKNIHRIVFYNELKQYVGNASIYAHDSFLTQTMPTNAKFIRVNVYILKLNDSQINEGIIELPYDPLGGERFDKAYIPKLDSDFLEKMNILEDFTGRTYNFDFQNKKVIKSPGNFPVIDTDIAGKYTSTDIVSNPTTVSNAKSADIYTLYDDLVAQYPTYITKTLLGNEGSALNLPIYRYDFKPVRPEGATDLKSAKIVIVSGTHPEKIAVWALYNMLKKICAEWNSSKLLEALRFNFHFIIVPIVNPWGYDAPNRTNANGVDIARNFTASWTQGVFGNQTYGGTAPLSEIETQLMNQLMIDNTDALGIIDFHSFQSSADGYGFLWCATANKLSSNIGMANVQRMDRIWKERYAFVNQNPDVLLGSVNGVAGSAPGGSMAKQADYLGFNGALTFEICSRVHANPTNEKYDTVSMTMGTEAITNFILQMAKAVLRN